MYKPPPLNRDYKRDPNVEALITRQARSYSKQRLIPDLTSAVCLEVVFFLSCLSLKNGPHMQALRPFRGILVTLEGAYRVYRMYIWIPGLGAQTRVPWFQP